MARRPHEEEIKDDIAERLERSDRKTWNSLSLKDQRAVVSKYYELRGEDYRNVRTILRENASLRRDFGLMFFGLILGILGSFVASAIIRSVPSTDWNNVLIVVFAVAGFFLVVRMAEQLIADDLGNEQALERLVDMVEKDQGRD